MPTSSRIYQGLTRGDLRDTVDRLHALMIGVEPDLTVLIDIDPGEGLARAVARAGKEMRFEGMGLGVQEKARDGFLALAAPASGAVSRDRRRARARCGGCRCSGHRAGAAMSDDLPEPDRIEGAPHPRHTARLIGQAQAEADVSAGLQRHKAASRLADHRAARRGQGDAGVADGAVSAGHTRR